MCRKSIWPEKTEGEETGWRMTASQLHHVPLSTMPMSRFAGRAVGDPRMLSMYAAYSDVAVGDEPSNSGKGQLSELLAYGNAQGLTGRGAIDGLCRLSVDLHDELLDTRRFSVFYRFVFFMCREPGQKSMTPSTAVDAWGLALVGRFRLLDQWCAFVKTYQRQTITEDTWNQVLEFSRSVHEDLSNYDPEGAWPVLVDEFVDKMYSSRSAVICDSNALLPTKRLDDRRATVSCKGTLLPGKLISSGSKRRRRDAVESAEQAESVNSIAQLFAEMPSPVSVKRVRSNETLAEMHDPMDEGSDLSRNSIIHGRPRLSANHGMISGSSLHGSADGSTDSCFRRPGHPLWPMFSERGLDVGPDVPVPWSYLT